MQWTGRVQATSQQFNRNQKQQGGNKTSPVFEDVVLEAKEYVLYTRVYVG
jgi:hypothetical protein